MSASELDRLRATDIYLIDQVLKGRLGELGCVVDVGAGAGRNLPWFVGCADRVVALDPRPEAFEAMDECLSELGLNATARAGVERCWDASRTPLEPGAADLVICNAVLHFAEGAAGEAMPEAWSLVAPGGMFFGGVGVGIEGSLVPLEGAGSFCPTNPSASSWTLAGSGWPNRLGAEQLEPVKTTVVSGLRAMSTWSCERRAERTTA